jgi:hypothetical protein
VPDRVLTARELNRAVLARQLLLERAALPPARAVERVAGLQTQYAPSGYVGLWSRLAGFRAADLTAALLSGTVVQAWVMRCAIHMVSARDRGPLTAAVREPRREWWRRAHRGLAPADVEAAAEVVRALLAGGPRRQAEIQAHLAGAGLPKGVWPGVQLWVDLLRAPPAGTWPTPRAHVYALAPPSAATAAAGEELLVRRYLRGFGPAPAKDVATFCGWTVTAARAVLARLELRRFRDESGGELLDLPRAPLPPPGTPAPVRFLGQWDAVLLVHARRAGVLPERHRPRVFATSMPQSVPTFLVDGQVAGTWERVGGQVVTTPFEQLTDAAAEEVRVEAERLAAFCAEADAGR